jgi:chaperone required for assembly of F1-ATPase
LKRFWTCVDIAAGAEGWRVLLDDKPVRLPGGAPLLLSGAALAEAVAAEWRAAGGGLGGEMSYADLPLTRLAGTAQERIAPDPEPVALELARYAESDLLCYRTERPEGLARRQDALWQPWLDWADRRFDARLRVTTGLMHVAQEPAALARLAQAVASLDVGALTALGIIVPGLGSLVLGLALAQGELDAATAHEIAAVDELYQEEVWGVDDVARIRRTRIREDLEAAGRFLAVTRPPA